MNNSSDFSHLRFSHTASRQSGRSDTNAAGLGNGQFISRQGVLVDGNVNFCERVFGLLAGQPYRNQIEELARSRALQMFDLNPDEWHVNVQPHSGTQANMAVYLSILQPGDKVMGMSLNAGGHLSHANPQGLAGKLYEAHQYDVDPDTGLIDYDAVLKLAKEVRPKLIICGASAYPRVIDFAKFRATVPDSRSSLGSKYPVTISPFS